MRYSDELIEEIIRRTNIVEIIGQYVQLKHTGFDYKGLCPFHNEKTPSFHVTPSKQLYYCFGCHAGGNVITFLMEYNNMTFVEALKYLADRAGIELPEQEISESARRASDRKAKLLEIQKKAAEFYYYRLYSAEGKPGLDYLHGRGLTDETIRKFGLGYADRFGNSLYRYLKGRGYSDDLLKDTGLFLYDERKGVSDKFWNRVMFPIQDGRGRVIGFGGRVMGDGKPKYLNSPETPLFNKRMNLYALHLARASRRGYMILCEGYMDVISMHQAGVNCAMASLGTALTPEQCTLLKRFTSEVLLLYDSDGAGIGAALRAIPLLKEAGISSRVVSLKPHKDPDEFIQAEGREAFEERLQNAENAFIFEMEQAAGKYTLSDPGQMTQFQHEVAARLLEFPEELERNNYIAAVSARFGFPQEALKKLVARTAAQGTPAAAWRPPKSGREKQAAGENGLVTSQKLMLTYLIDYPDAYRATKDLIGSDDFTDPFCREVADILYEQLGKGRVSEAALISHFPESERQSEAAALFHTTVPVESQAELDRAFTDTVARVLASGNDALMRSWDGTDLDVYRRYIDRKKKLDGFAAGKTLHLAENDSK